LDLEHTFTVPAPLDRTWAAFEDIESVAGCFPGATVTEFSGDDFKGTCKVKLGPIALTYSGSGTFVAKDREAGRFVIEAKGKDKRGNGTAGARVTAQLTEEGTSTKVDVTTDLAITGKPAQFGRGVMAEISGKLITQFADCLAAEITGDGDAPEAASDRPPADNQPEDDPLAAKPDPEVAASNGASRDAADSAPPTLSPPLRPVAAPAARPTPEAIDLLGTAGLPMLKRIGPVVAVLGILFGFVLRRRRRR
jgi:uncharacterized protein